MMGGSTLVIFFQYPDGARWGSYADFNWTGDSLECLATRHESSDNPPQNPSFQLQFDKFFF
jgi:hypothetical protein